MNRFHRVAPALAVTAVAAGFTVAGASPAKAEPPGAAFPDPGIEGFEFPRDATTLDDWVYNQKMDRIYKHAWGIWAGLTTPVNQTDSPVVASHGIDNPPVYLTWFAPSKIAEKLKKGEELGAPPGEELHLHHPRQFAHGGKTPTKAKDAAKSDLMTHKIVTVNYSPAAARASFNNKLFLKSTWNKLAKRQYAEMPNFPYDAITIKPVYKIVREGSTAKQNKLPVWPGPPKPAKQFKQKDWGTCVYVKPGKSDNSSGRRSVDDDCSDGPKTATTFGTDSFVGFQLKDHHAVKMDKTLLHGGEGRKLKAGDHLILVGMHVGTRERKRWTWQSFWWTPTPGADPHKPSSKAIQAAKPGNKLHGAAKNYNMTTAYSMLTPPQPFNGGKNTGNLNIGFNPYLEAGFGKKTIKNVRPVKQADGSTVKAQYGVQSNCMTCHALASRSRNGDKPGYAADFYLPQDDNIFDGHVKADFAWSVVGNLVKKADDDTAD